MISINFRDRQKYKKTQQVDIFSPEGKYLYRSFITPGNDLIEIYYK
jgi:hypothetical protein